MRLELQPRGPFALASAARFIAGWPPAARPDAATDEVVRLAFLVDDWSGHAAVTLRQRADGTVEGELESTGDAARARAQAASILSLDHDGEGYAAVGERDRVVGRLQSESGFLRPVLFHSPYEAACWAVLSARIGQAQAARVRDALSAEHGAVVPCAGERMLAFPAPGRLLAVEDFPGVPDEKLRRMHGIARAALTGALDRDRLRTLPHEEAVAELARLRGIGPFWSQAILLRAVGPTDAPAGSVAPVRAAAARAYGLPDVRDDEHAFAPLAERWRPYRTWVAVLLRATAEQGQGRMGA
jgi:DNA-3-methyladenine glycosylase II